MTMDTISKAVEFWSEFYDRDVMLIADHIVCTCLIINHKAEPILYKNDGMSIDNDHTKLIVFYTLYGYVENVAKEAFDRINYYIVLNGLNKHIEVKLFNRFSSNEPINAYINLCFSIDKINELKIDFKLKEVI